MNFSIAEFASLDKGLRSAQPGKQCEAILLFPPLLQRGAQDPLLLNSVLLKLADVFQSSNNLSRYCIVQVLVKCATHLKEVRSAHEFLKRTTVVLSSFDTLARSLTLRLLGACATLCAEWLEVHHQVRKALGSAERVEVLASIFAIDRLCAASSRFSCAILPSVMELLRGMSMQMEAKCRLAAVLRHMHHTPSMALDTQTGAECLLQMLPPRELAVALLIALTKLCCKCIITASQQVDLLVRVATSDLRADVRAVALKGILCVLRRAAHSLPSAAMHPVRTCCYALLDETPYSPRLCTLALVVLRHLLKAGPTDAQRVGEVEGGDAHVQARLPSGATISHALQLMAGGPRGVAVAAAQFLATVVHVRSELELGDAEQVRVKGGVEGAIAFALCETLVHWDEREVELSSAVEQGAPRKEVDAMDVDSDAPESNDGVAVGLCLPSNPGQLNASVSCELRTLVKSLIEVVRDMPALSARVVTRLLDTLENQSRQGGANNLLICRCIASCTGAVAQGREEIQNRVLHLLSTLEGKLSPDAILQLIGAALATMPSSEVAQGSGPVLRAVVSSQRMFLEQKQLWPAYKLARKCSCSGLHAQAANIYASIQGWVESDVMYWWLYSLKLVSEAESELPLAPSGIGALRASEKLTKAAQCFLAAANPGSEPAHTFQHQLVSLRAEYLQCVATVASILQSFSDPEAYFGSAPHSAPSTHSRYPPVGSLEIADRVRKLISKFASLQTLFMDMDPSSMRTLEGYSLQCALLLRSVYVSLILPCTAGPGDLGATAAATDLQLKLMELRSKGESTASLQGAIALANVAIKGPESNMSTKDWMIQMLENCLKLPHALPSQMFCCRHQCQVEVLIKIGKVEACSTPVIQRGQALAVVLQGMLQHVPAIQEKQLRTVLLELVATPATTDGGRTEERDDGGRDEGEICCCTLQASVQHRQTSFEVDATMRMDGAHPGEYRLMLRTHLLDTHGTVWPVQSSSGDLLVRVEST